MKNPEIIFLDLHPEERIITVQNVIAGLERCLAEAHLMHHIGNILPHRKELDKRERSEINELR
ncbi:hypothetical protein LJC33_00400 [Eubacteriales bacterium OttesenSCG-928-N13]|nr:hypothetical protein [Eubacteriales bacterium OttesenSCG-928-N13]